MGSHLKTGRREGALSYAIKDLLASQRVFTFTYFDQTLKM
jgi:hypothetical protein